ncbi:hypothetical protein MC378_10320 [Polaribacter sp. MSW13]|uniref:Uncharacterized protein n=1 Tax=Polaribacter marinus TaxID=2916838 RepID=A0A9X1VNQ6_9FLAO|nr:hypothetical protein [Polaribacter marinus]MCI2229562.1 hypothetical protein [Polaribacter marinus]
MPKIEKVFTLDVTPTKFLEACSGEELIELELLLSSKRFQTRIDVHRKLKENY